MDTEVEQEFKPAERDMMDTSSGVMDLGPQKEREEEQEEEEEEEGQTREEEAPEQTSVNDNDMEGCEPADQGEVTGPVAGRRRRARERRRRGGPAGRRPRPLLGVPPRPGAGEAQLRRLRPVLRQRQRAARPQAQPHGRASVPLFAVRRLVHPEGQPAAPHQAPLRREALQVPHVQLRLPPPRRAQRTPAHALRGEALQVQSLRSQLQTAQLPGGAQREVPCLHPEQRPHRESLRGHHGGQGCDGQRARPAPGQAGQQRGQAQELHAAEVHRRQRRVSGPKLQTGADPRGRRHRRGPPGPRRPLPPPPAPTRRLRPRPRPQALPRPPGSDQRPQAGPPAAGAGPAPGPDRFRPRPGPGAAPPIGRRRSPAAPVPLRPGAPAGGARPPQRPAAPPRPSVRAPPVAPGGATGGEGRRRGRGRRRGGRGVPVRPLPGDLPGLRHVHHPHGLPRLPRPAGVQRLRPPQPRPLRVLVAHRPRRAPPGAEVGARRLLLDTDEGTAVIFIPPLRVKPFKTLKNTRVFERLSGGNSLTDLVVWGSQFSG